MIKKLRELANYWDADTEESRQINAAIVEIERIRAENVEYKEALLQIAHGDTWTAYPHDIAAWALKLERAAIRNDNE